MLPRGNCHYLHVCTVVVSLEPDERMPLRLLGIRDELTSRPWRPPARHWPGLPLIGGIDEQAGGTWLAVHPEIPRVACLLNARGALADPARRRSRGDLSLRAAAEGPDMLGQLADDPDALAFYDPFHLICATPDSVTTLTWLGSSYPPGGRPPVPPDVRAAGPDRKDRDRIRPARTDKSGGMTPVVRELAPGTHLFTNAGHAYPVEPGDPAGDPKAVHFADKFAAARPSADPALPVAQAWGDWLTLAAGDGLDPADPAAVIVRRDLPGGGVYGTTSVTLVALADGAIRYDFQPRPGNQDGWYAVSVS
jgi:Transport and Golgi organisation 2